MIPKKIKKELQLLPKKGKSSEAASSHLPLMPLSLHRQTARKPMTLKQKMSNLEKCLKKLKSKDSKKPKEPNENTKPNHETIADPESSQAPVEVTVKRKPGRPMKKKINLAIMP